MTTMLGNLREGIVFQRLFGTARPEFVETVADYVRSKQDEDFSRIDIPSTRFKDPVFIHNAFVANGRLPVSIDVKSFASKTSVVTQDGEFWSGELISGQETCVFRLQLTATEIFDLDKELDTMDRM